MNRNHYFLVGVVVLLIGIQLRLVDSFVLNEKATEFIAQRTDDKQDTPGELFAQSFPQLVPEKRRTVSPPDWIGWAVLCVGAVLILHSLAMPKAG